MNLAVNDFIMYFSKQQSTSKEIDFFFEYEGLEGESGFKTDLIFLLDGEEIVELHPKTTKEKSMRIFLIDLLNQIEIQSSIDPFLKLFAEYKKICTKIQIKKERYERLPHEIKNETIGFELFNEIQNVLEEKKEKMKKDFLKRIKKNVHEKAYFLIAMNEKDLIQVNEQFAEKQIRIV